MDPGQPQLVNAICLLTAVGVLAYMFYEFYTRKHDLLSYRNLYLLGFVHFQALSGFFSGLTNEPWRGQPFDSRSYYLFAASLLVFLVMFFWAYRRDTLARFVGHIFPSRSAPPTSGWILIGIVLGLLAGVLAILVVQTGHPFLSALAGQMVFGAFIFSIVLCTYLWIRSPANPLFLALMVLLPPLTIVLSTVGAHGRREMVGVLLGIIWGIYMFRWRFQTTRKIMIRFAVIGALAFAVLMAYTAVRGAYKGRWGVDEADAAVVARMRLQSLQQADFVTQGIFPILFTDTANNSIFVIDRWGREPDKAHEPFFALRFVLVNPIPREWWPDKPIGFGKTVPLALDDPAFSRITLGPGVIGHGWHEMAIFGVAFYGLFFGLLTRGIDEKLMRQVRNPFFVAATGSLLGHTVGMARGDIGNFMVNAIGAMLAPFGILVVLGVLSGGGGREAAAAELAEMEAAEDDYEAYIEAYGEAAYHEDYGDYADPDFQEAYDDERDDHQHLA
jgi:hypothetical protein